MSSTDLGGSDASPAQAAEVVILSRLEAEERAALIRVRRYDVVIDISAAAVADLDTFTSRTTVEFDSAQVAGSSFIDLAATRLIGATLNGADVRHDWKGGRLQLDGLMSHNVLEVEAEFAYGGEWQGMQRMVDSIDGELYVRTTTFIAEAPKIFACFDQPDMKGRYTFHVRAPKPWTVISNAPVDTVERLSGADQIVHFQQTQPLATYVTAVMAGPFHRTVDVVEGPDGPIELGICCTASDAKVIDPEHILGLTKAGFDLFHRLFDFPYPFGKYDQLLLEPSRSGMENVGAVSLGRRLVFTSRMTQLDEVELAYVVLHELSHMWFGNLVTTRWWNDTWLNEAFATFAGYFAMANATSHSDAWTRFAQQQKNLALEADQLPSTHPIAGPAPDVETAFANFDQVTYAKGASVLRQLVAYVGEQAFFTGLARYFKDHAHSNAALADLLAALEDASGTELSTWADGWLLEAHPNTLRPELTADAQGRLASLAVRQEGHAPGAALRSHRVSVGLYQDKDGRLVRTHGTEISVSGSRTDLTDLVGLPVPELVIVDDRDLTYAKQRFDDASLAVLKNRISDIDDALARTVCWTALWDMTRSGELSAGAYVDVALAAVEVETEPSILDGLLGHLGRLLASGFTPQEFARRTGQLADVAVSALGAAPPGTDRQLTWARAVATSAGSGPHAPMLRALFDGSLVIDGLEMDFDLRWRCMRGLAAFGHSDAAEIARVLAEEPTDEAHELAAAASASLATAADKARAWERALHDDEPAMVRLAYASAFWQPAPAELLSPYVDRYFESLESVWQSLGGSFLARALTAELFPQVYDQSTMDRCDEWLANPDRAAVQRRVVVDRRDELARSLRQLAEVRG